MKLHILSLKKKIKIGFLWKMKFQVFLFWKQNIRISDFWSIILKSCQCSVNWIMVVSSKSDNIILQSFHLQEKILLKSINSSLLLQEVFGFKYN